MATPMKPKSTRPMPPPDLGRFAEGSDHIVRYAPAPELRDWAIAQILTEGAPLWNEDHFHLQGADLEFLWAAGSFEKAMRSVVGQAEQVAFRVSGWQRGRQEQQMEEWFGRVPGFLITIAADFAREASDMEFAAVVEHELYHIGHLHLGGVPQFFKDTGAPKLAIRGHDIEEFVGVVRRYGPISQDVADMVKAAGERPEVSGINMQRACGTCLLRAA